MQPWHPWGSPPFGLTPILEEQSKQLSDVPPGPSDLSPALVHKLAVLQLEEIALLCRYRNLRTVGALWQLDAGERKLWLIAARRQYELLGVFPSNIKNNLEKLFGPIVYPEEHIPSGLHGTYAEIWQQQQQQQVPFPEPPEPLVDDSSLRRSIGENLLALRPYIDDDRYAECVHRLRRADEHAVAALSETAEALAAISVQFPEGSREFDVCKDAKRVMRDFLLFRAVSTCPGMDSTPALQKAWLRACQYTRWPCELNIDSQMQNALWRIKQMLGGGPPPKKRADSHHSPERPPANNRQGSASSSSSATTPSNHAQNASGKVRLESNGSNFTDQIRHSWRPPGPERGFDAPLEEEASGGRSRDGDKRPQMHQLLEMMTALTQQVMELKSRSRCD